MNGLFSHKNKEQESIQITLKLTTPRNRSAVEIHGLPDSFDKKAFKKRLSKATASSVSIKKKEGYVFAMGNASAKIIELLKEYGITSIDVIGRT